MAGSLNEMNKVRGGISTVPTEVLTGRKAAVCGNCHRGCVFWELSPVVLGQSICTLGEPKGEPKGISLCLSPQLSGLLLPHSHLSSPVPGGILQIVFLLSTVHMLISQSPHCSLRISQFAVELVPSQLNE